MNATKYRTPGQLIEALLLQRGWSNRVLAAVLDLEETGVSKLISAKKAVTPEMSILLEEVVQENHTLLIMLLKFITHYFLIELSITLQK